jgi:hypothetical protein
MRLVHWSVLGNHMHLIVEACDRHALARGMQGLGVRLARALNRCWGRAGRVLADRYHAHVLRSPREVRNALAYVLENAAKHRLEIAGADPRSSAPWFDGWLGGDRVACADFERPTWLRAARSWLLAHGWRRVGPARAGRATGGTVSGWGGRGSGSGCGRGCGCGYEER